MLTSLMFSNFNEILKLTFLSREKMLSGDHYWSPFPTPPHPFTFTSMLAHTISFFDKLRRAKDEMGRRDRLPFCTAQGQKEGPVPFLAQRSSRWGGTVHA